MNDPQHSVEDPESLLKDISLSKIWYRLNVKGRKGVRNSIWSATFVVLSGLASSAYAYECDAVGIPEQIRFISLHGLKLTTGVLSFLLAGFVFFLSTSHTDLLHSMFRMEEDQTGLDYLRYNTFSLMALFAEFVVGALIFALVVVFGQINGVMPYFLDFFHDSVREAVLRIGFVVTSCVFILLVLRLRTFIINYYHFSMTALVVAFDKIAEEEEKAAEEEKSSQEI